MMEAGVKPIGIHAGKILNLELDEGSSELARVPKFYSECICIQLD